jgi:hypothetical protein
LNDAAPFFKVVILNHVDSDSGDCCDFVFDFCEYESSSAENFPKCFYLIQNHCTSGLIVLGFVLISQSNWSSNMSFGWDAFQNLKQTEWKSISGALFWRNCRCDGWFGFQFCAWENVTFISGEIENPKKNVVKAMILGTSAVMILYLLVNFVYLNALDRDSIAFAAMTELPLLLLKKCLEMQEQLSLQFL